jgi:hypothetical protein
MDHQNNLTNFKMLLSSFNPSSGGESMDSDERIQQDFDLSEVIFVSTCVLILKSNKLGIFVVDYSGGTFYLLIYVCRKGLVFQMRG